MCNRGLAHVARTMVLALALLAPSLVVIPASYGAEVDVSLRTTRFNPEELRIDPGDRVTWTNQDQQLHDVRSDEPGLFGSGNLSSGETFSRTFNTEGYFYYFCSFHGGPGQVGMSGVVVVGDPPPPPPPDDGGTGRAKIVVPRDYGTIGEAVDAAPPGAKIVLRPGTYNESVRIDKPGITLKGRDRFRTVIHGNDEVLNGIIVTGTEDVEIRNLTVRNFRRAGVFINDTTGYLVHKVDSIKNRSFGIYAFDSYDGVFRKSYAYGSGDSAFYVGQCFGCSALVKRVKAVKSFIGYSGTNATGVVVMDSVFARNGAGIVPNSFPWEEHEPNRGTTIIDNVVRGNNYSKVPPSGMSQFFGLPYGTGIWLWGVQNSEVVNNKVVGNDSYGILVTPSHNGEHMALNNRVTGNEVSGSDIASVAIDGGTNNCLRNNSLLGALIPENAADVYGCEMRPFTNEDQLEMRDEIREQANSPNRTTWEEPPEPKRPKCQRGKPGCKR